MYISSIGIHAFTPTLTPTIEPTIPAAETKIFTITAYCSCAKCCGKTDGITYSGAKVQEGFTCAADLSVLGLGSIVEIEGLGIRTVQDKGSKVKGDHIDVYFPTHSEALKFGKQYRKVKILKEVDS